jgi:hypothetical protein
MYITFDQFSTLYAPIEEKVFTRLSFDAERLIDNHTTGVDGVKKLRIAFPSDEYAKDAVMHCAGNIVNLLHQIHEAEQTAAVARGYTETAQGLQRKIISRVEAGNEAISYSETKLANSSVDAAVADKSVRDALIASTIKEYLSGITDANGVNLLYMGSYPRRYTNV